MELDPLAQLDPVVVGGTMVVFGATYAALRRVFFDPVIDAMEERRARCEAAAETCSGAEALIADAKAAAAAAVEGAREEADRVLAGSREAAEAERDARVADARERAEGMLRAGRAEILEAREAEVAALTTEARECVSLACSKLVGHVDDEVVAEVVDRVVGRTLR